MAGVSGPARMRQASGWAKRVPKSSLRRQTISHRIATHRRPLLSLQDALETSFAPRRALSLTPWRSASPSDLPSLDPQLSDLRHLQASGSPQDLHQLVSKIDSLLDKSALEPTERGLLESEEVWTMYVQAKTELGKQGSVADLVAALQQKSARRAEVLRVGAAGEGQTVEQRLAAYNLTPATLVSSIFSRPGVNASSSAGVSSTNAPVSSNAPPAPPPATPAAAGAMHLDDAHRLNEQFIAAQRSTSSSSSSGAGSQSSHSSSSSQSGPSGSTAGAAAGTAAPGEPIRVIVEENKGSILWRMARFIGVTAVYSFIMLTFLSLLMDSSGLLRATAAGGQPTEFQPQSQKAVNFNDVHGCDEAKDELQEVVEFLKDPPKFARLGGRLPRGVLLTGPPGTGKTLLARAVAGEAGVQFFIASGSEFDEMYVGVGARRIRELFAAARKAAPAIIFIDELDAIGSKRSPKDQHYIKQTLNQLLVELDGFQQHEGVILMAATNFPQSLDKALTRPGRFDRHVAVPLPDARGRIQILKHHIKTVTVDQALDLSTIARGTPGFSGADLQNLVNQAAVKASREGAPIVTVKHFEWARDRISMGAEAKSYITTPEQKRHTAYHEAGHALVSIYTPGATPLHKVTCLRRGHALGLTHFLPELDKSSESYTEYKARLDVAMGGRAAEELLLGKANVTSGATSDIDQATRVATAMVRQMGFSDDLGPRAYREDEVLSTQTLSAIESEVRVMVEAAQQRALDILTKHRTELDRLAEALIEWETLDADEARLVIKGGKLDREDPF